MNRRTAIAGACLLGPLLTGSTACSASLHIGGTATDKPECLKAYQGRPEHLNGTLVLAAQSVPTAALVPCVRRLPAGWTFGAFKADRGRTRFWLQIGTDNAHAVTMTFTRTCDLGTARRTASDEPGTARFDQPEPEPSGYRGTRFYTFAGGCVAYEFDVHGAAAGEAVATISRALAFVDRDRLRRYVHDYSDGRFELDPAPGG
jgi:hypothetical protein